MILVDGRVGSGHLVKLIRNAGAKVQKMHLTSGDISLPGNGPNGPISIGIEVMKPADLCQKLITGRLVTKQIPLMRRTYDEIIIAIEGRFCASKTGGVAVRKVSEKGFPIQWEIPTSLSWRQLQAKILSLQYGHQLRYREFSDGVELAYWIAVLSKWFSREWSDHKSHLPSGHHIFQEPGEGMLPILPYEPTNTEMAAHAIPGFGFALAQRVAQHFSNVKAMANASLNDWFTIDGVGKKKAGEAFLFFNEKTRRQG